MPSVVPTDRTSSAVSGSWASEVPLVQRHEGEIAGNEHQAGDPRADGRRGEPAVGLQQPVENDREPVQQGLGSEHHAASRGDGDHVGVDAVRVRVAGVQQRGDRPGGRHDDQAQRHHDDNGPGQQRRGDLADPRLLRRVTGRPLGRASQHRDHRAGQRAAQDQLVQQIRHLVRGDVRRAQAARADGLREHQRADQAQYPGQYRQASDDEGAAGDAVGQPLAELALGSARPPQGWSAQATPDPLACEASVQSRPCRPTESGFSWRPTYLSRRGPDHRSS